VENFGLTKLGRPAKPSRDLECFENKYAGRPFTVKLTFTEYTSLCPVTSQPDFGTVIIEYAPDKKIIEMKSLKLFFATYRNERIFNAFVVNEILDAIRDACHPFWVRVTGIFTPRGAMTNEVSAFWSRDEGT